jgi:hypothetical protein
MKTVDIFGHVEAIKQPFSACHGNENIWSHWPKIHFCIIGEENQAIFFWDFEEDRSRNLTRDLLLQYCLSSIMSHVFFSATVVLSF